MGKFLSHITVFFACLTPLGVNASIDSLLNVLDETIQSEAKVDSRKYNRISDLLNKLGEGERSPSDTFTIYDSLFQEYRSFQYDSAFSYALKQFELANTLNDDIRRTHAKLNLTFVLRSAGLYKEVFDSLKTIKPTTLKDDLLTIYYEQMARSHYDLAAFNRDGYYSVYNSNLGNAYADSALASCPTKNLRYHRIAGLKAEANNQHREASFVFHTIIEEFPVSQHQYAMACYSLGKISEELEDPEKSLEWIILAAISDIQSNTKEAVALMDLARYLFDQGDIDRAYNYISKAASDAKFYGARQRILQVSQLFPKIEAAKLSSVRQESTRWLTILVAVCIISLIILALALIIFRQYKQLSQTKENLQSLNEKLQEANTIKERYIGHSFSKDAEYLNKLEKLKSEVEKKLLNRKFDDLKYVLRLVNLKKEQEALFAQFDAVFLKLFPNFITHFNSFFQPEDQISLKKDSSMPIELRIFALIRIGITDHEQIASITRYSVRTIYNYKNIIKNRSLLPNNEFEEKLMEVKTFD